MNSTLNLTNMKQHPETAWDLIGHDPQLRCELTEIETHTPDERLIELLIEFFTRLDRLHPN
jgi:hypothetical protein